MLVAVLAEAGVLACVALAEEVGLAGVVCGAKMTFIDHKININKKFNNTEYYYNVELMAELFDLLKYIIAIETWSTTQ